MDSNVEDQAAVGPQHHSIMVRTKTTPRITPGVKLRIPCIRCGKSFASLKTLRRHASHAHVSYPTWYKCQMCRKTLSRKDAYARHMKVEHPGYDVEAEVVTEEPKKPEPLRRPVESLTRAQLEVVKFRTRPAKSIMDTGPTSSVRPIMEEVVDMLKQDLELSDSDSEDTASIANSSEGELVDYKELGYVSEGTDCQDELDEFI